MWKNKLSALKEENDNLCIEMPMDDEELIKKMLRYMGVTKLSTVELELMRKDLVGIALEARLRGETLEQAIGSGQEFCDEILAGGSGNNWLEYVIALGKRISLLTALSAVILGMIQTNSWERTDALESPVPILAVALILIVGGSLYDLHMTPKALLYKGAKKWCYYIGGRFIFMTFMVLLLHTNIGIVLWTNPVVWIDMRPVAAVCVALSAVICLIHECFKYRLASKMID